MADENSPLQSGRGVPLDKRVIRGNVADIIDRYAALMKAASDLSPYRNLAYQLTHAEKEVTLKRLDIVSRLTEDIMEQREEWEDKYERMQRIGRILGFKKYDEQQETATDLSLEKFDQMMGRITALDRNIMEQIDKMSGLTEKMLEAMTTRAQTKDLDEQQSNP